MGFIHLQGNNEVLAVLKPSCLSVDKLSVFWELSDNWESPVVQQVRRDSLLGN